MNASTAPNHVAAALQTLANILADSQATITHRLRAACTILRFSMRPPAEAPSERPALPLAPAGAPPAPPRAPSAIAAATPLAAPSRAAPASAPPVSPLYAPRASPVLDLLSRAGAPPPHFARAFPAPLLTLHPP